MIKKCAFGGSIGEVKEVERGIITKPEREKGNTLYWLDALINKRQEYQARKGYKII